MSSRLVERRCFAFVISSVLIWLPAFLYRLLDALLLSRFSEKNLRTLLSLSNLFLVFLLVRKCGTPEGDRLPIHTVASTLLAFSALTLVPQFLKEHSPREYDWIRQYPLEVSIQNNSDDHATIDQNISFRVSNSMLLYLRK